MVYQIYRTSNHHSDLWTGDQYSEEPPVAGAFPIEGRFCYCWTEERSFPVWFVRIETVEDLEKIRTSAGAPLIFREGKIEIYDQYRE